ncbi:bifunctional diguanylate cyclase/phosphodiesterase [Duganella sp. HH105]|uniref:putative bifunctional diguanylate cyclase/phosphodiesterase n=1 Tax=Duganella sp. HH105 TaxID=1781067 RepID=UPI000892D988|nr:bifunctional diguanylate cyclase/phosphodiesterase [Duganella sp. HH105]OEZ63740.1 cyclic di-GMP phosphodiesterase Gmr [Duganella sp. HH105]
MEHPHSLTLQADRPPCPWQGAAQPNHERTPAAPQGALPQACHHFACAILDALPAQVVVLGLDGTILAINAAWRNFARDNAGHLGCADIGSNYLDVCRAATGDDADCALRACAGIEQVLAGDAPSFELEYACHTPRQQRWFSMNVTPLGYGAAGVVITHNDITERRQHEARLRIAAIAFESTEGMMVTDANSIIVQVNHAFTDITGYASDEVIGRRPNMLSSGRHDAAFYQAMHKAVATTGTWEGEIWNRRKNGEIYPERLHIAAVRDEDGRTTHYVAALTDITLSKAANDEIKNLAFYDPLTRLPNRRLLMDRLRQVLAASALSGSYGALMFIDLDNFKTLNDTLGHNTGDLLLQQVAARLRACLRQADTVARLGGDEFVVLIDGMSRHALEAAAQTEALGSKILATLNQPYQLGAHHCHSTPSIGATLFHDEQRQQPDELLMQADIAMYQAKQAGRNGMRFFDQRMQDTLSARAHLENELRTAFDHQQFELYYQGQVDAGGRATGAEALIRWIKPDGSSISPAQFIPLAEETGLILLLGDWVLEQACRQLRDWQREAATRELVLSINVSAKQFRQADFCARVRSAIERYGIVPARLKLELTEGLLLDNIEDTIASMTALKALGIKFSLDDFGTGYSSLQYLKRLPLDQLKIDQSFVRDLASDANDQAIVLTIIAMARSLRLDVIAEGVETPAQRQLLSELGCDAYQGYLYCRPLPAPAFDGWLAAAPALTAAG